MPFTCNICERESTRICAWCTKDSCDDHLCEKCARCSDCCECEVALTEPNHEPARAPHAPAAPVAEGAGSTEAARQDAAGPVDGAEGESGPAIP